MKWQLNLTTKELENEGTLNQVLKFPQSPALPASVDW